MILASSSSMAATALLPTRALRSCAKANGPRARTRGSNAPRRCSQRAYRVSRPPREAGAELRTLGGGQSRCLPSSARGSPECACTRRLSQASTCSSGSMRRSMTQPVNDGKLAAILRLPTSSDGTEIHGTAASSRASRLPAEPPGAATVRPSGQRWPPSGAALPGQTRKKRGPWRKAKGATGTTSTGLRKSTGNPSQASGSGPEASRSRNRVP
mmetsp:Transcript_28224/g.77711  ORF Transcript_28224/g.77711 Transcript_28224/m.77711 type:complete len:213 (+) Transcript_28224:396-1034(+)